MLIETIAQTSLIDKLAFLFVSFIVFEIIYNRYNRPQG